MGLLQSRAGYALAAAAALAVVLGAGWLVPEQPLLAMVLGVTVLALGVALFDAALIPLLLLPGLYVTQRVALGGTDLSVSDVALALAVAPAVVLGHRPLAEPVRQILWLVTIYQVASLFTVIANPYAANTIEWVHTWFLIGGALLVGWTIGRGGHGPAGLKLMLAAATVLAGWVVVVGLSRVARGDFAPIYLPYGMHKNFLGTVLAITALVAYVRPAWLGLGRRLAALLFGWLVLATGFTQSRQAIVGLGVALVVLVLRTRTDRRRSQLVLLAVVPAIAVVLTMVRDQIVSGNEFNSAFQRLTWFEDSLEIWRTNPVVGVGLRWWYTDRFGEGFQPPNAELEVLTSAGVVGLLGFLALMIGSVLVLWRVEPAYGMLAVLAVLSRFVQGQLDIFWVAAQCSVPFVIAGICLGVQALHEDEGVSAADLEEGEADRTGARAGRVVSTAVAS